MTAPLAHISRVVLRAPRAPNTLFLDRDGVLNHAVIRGVSVSSPRKWEEYRIADDIVALAAGGIPSYWNLVIVTNQPDISRGTINFDLLQRIHESMAERIPLSAVYICPHVAEDACECRKPKAGMIQQFRREHPELGGREFLVGDRESDMQCAEEAGMPFILRLRHYNQSLRRVAPRSIHSLWDLEQTLNETWSN